MFPLTMQPFDRGRLTSHVLCIQTCFGFANAAVNQVLVRRARGSRIVRNVVILFAEQSLFQGFRHGSAEISRVIDQPTLEIEQSENAEVVFCATCASRNLVKIVVLPMVANRKGSTRSLEQP